MGDLGEEWEVDDYRGDHESDEHWTLRREFMVTNKSAFPRLRLLSLSQVFSNVEFMGCRYPEETMAIVAELSTGIVEGYRAKQKSRLQRTFVKASAAAEAKSKRVFHSNENSSTSSTSASTTGSVGSSQNQRRRGPKRNSNTDPPAKKMKSKNDTDLSTLVLVEIKYSKNENAVTVLHQSCQKSGKEYTLKVPVLENGAYRSVFQLGDFVVEGSGESKNAAKNNTAELTLMQLQKICYTIHINSTHVASSEDEIGKDDLLKRKQGGEHAPLQEDNVGNKLMRLMGYTGGALGKTGQGIETPIDTSDSIGRQRLGLGSGRGSDGNEKLTHGIAVKFLEAQIRRPEWKDLVFAPDLSNDERSIIHSAASRLGLKSRSFGKASERFMVIGKKILLWDLLQELLASGSTEQYQVFPPGDEKVNSKSANTS